MDCALLDTTDPTLAGVLLLLVVGLLGVLGCTSESAKRPPVTLQEHAEGYLFTEGRDSIMLYRPRARFPDRAHARSHYIHPLYGWDGTVLTEDFPADHPHQHGIFWAWHQVYVNGERVGDGWTQADIGWAVQAVEPIEDDRAGAALRARVHWTSPRWTGTNGQPTPFVEETMTLRAHPATETYRAIDVRIELRALAEDVRLGGSEDEKGYGGFSARVRLPEDVRFVGPDGPVEPTVTAVAPRPWVDVSATYAGEAPSGLAILAHSSGPDYPPPWILRREASMQNAKYPGATPVRLPRDEPLTLRYRLIVHQGHAGQVPLDRLHAEYTAAGGEDEEPE